MTQLRLPCTWRLGPQTTALIQPAFYAELPFSSARPPRHIQFDGAVLPELSIRLASPLAGPGDPILAASAAERVRDLLSGGLVVDGTDAPRRVQPTDVAVITPHVEQASAVAARLADVPGVLIGTANQAQGLEREAVVVIHPLAGYREAPHFATDPGRLCVALSRHRDRRRLATRALRRTQRLRAGNPALRPVRAARIHLTARRGPLPEAVPSDDCSAV